jgi:hypothetical protein
MLKRLSPYWLWLVLALPALTMISPFFDENTRALRGVLHGSGEFAARRPYPSRPVCSERRSRSKRSNAYTFNTTISILHTHASQPRSSEETGRHRDSTVRVLLLGTLYTAQRTPAPIARISTRTLQYLA